MEIARRILGRVRHGVRFDDVAVLLRSPERYRSLIEEALSRARIPVFFSSGARRPNPAGRAFLSLLRCREEGLSATRFAEYLSLSREYSPAAWERMLVDAAVIGGKARWVTRLNGLAEEFRNRYEKAQDDSESERWSRKIESLEDLTKIALPVIQSLDELPAEAKWGEWLDLLSELAASTVEEPEEVLELLDQLRPMAMIGPIRLSQVLLTLGPDLATHRTQTEGNRYGRVFVGSIEEARGLAFDTVFLPGLNEGIFPKLAREDPLLLDEQRAQLGVPTSEDDTGLLRTAVACSRERLVASWSRIDLATGRERVPSFYAFELFEAAWGGNPDLKAFETEARKGSESRLGWPAPLDPLNAIDDAEYDLARLRIALKEKEAGSAAYLGEINPHVVPALRARWLRWRKKWGWADGLLSEKEVLPALDRWRPAQHAYSATELEQYARCPYRFLLRSVYHLRPEQDATAIQRMEPRMRGEIYHDVQQHLFERLKSIGSLPIVPENVGECLVVLDELVQSIGEEARERYAPAVPEVWKADVGRLRADLIGWVHKVAEQAPEWTPEHFEWEFQNTRISGGWLLSGRVDLIERHADGSLRITDHKTGKYPEKPALRVGAGEVLQPVLYGLAAESLLGLPVKSGRLFYATLRQNYREIAMPLDAGARASAESVISAVDEALKDAFLPAAPRKDACKNCDYLPVCGPYEEERTGRGKKDSARLHSLTRIRESR
ncbi:MAG: exodeoxyribonuclease V subunit gamma [Bryobacteraceae bacterium]|nr:exodeoxyribonuclease V subunit gamma [Bryobacteraceae bacterium]